MNRPSSSLDIFFKAVQSQEVPHAILFHGVSIEDVQAVARRCARMIVMQDQNRENFLEEGHPDISEYSSEEKSSGLSIDIIREIRKNIWIQPFESSRKVFILHAVDRMSIPATNAFLKTLEEPPAHAVIILTTTKKHVLLPTIISRVRAIRVPGEEYNHLTEEDITFLFSLLLGKIPFLRIASFFEKEEDRKFLDRRLLKGILEIFRDRALLQYGVDHKYLVHKKYIKKIQELPFLPLQEVVDLVQIATDRIALSTNKAFCFEWISLQINRMKQQRNPFKLELAKLS